MDGIEFLVLEWNDDLRLAPLDLYLDSRQPRSFSFVSHAHADHIASHRCSVATAQTLALLERRIGSGGCSIELPYHADHAVGRDAVLRLLPAGHVLGSAMLHLSCNEGTLLYTGDFKLRESLTLGPAEPARADVLVMECTYGNPLFRFPPWRQVAEELVELVRAAMEDGRQPIVLGYSLGKAQELTRILTDAGLVVTLHGAAWTMHQQYEMLSNPVGPARRYVWEDFHGPEALDLRERGVLIAPPHVARTPFVTRFKNPLRIMASGWGMMKNAQYRFGVDRVLPLSDHADFDALMDLIARVAPKKIYTHHGSRDFAERLKMQGFDAQCARPDLRCPGRASALPTHARAR